MKTLRRRLALFSFALVVLMYLRHYDQATRLMGWSVVLGLGSAYVLTHIKGLKPWH